MGQFVVWKYISSILLILKSDMMALAVTVTPVYHYSFFVGYIPETQSIGLPPGQDDIHTLLVSSLVAIS
jgi:hypothetical protein